MATLSEKTIREMEEGRRQLLVTQLRTRMAMYIKRHGMAPLSTPRRVWRDKWLAEMGRWIDDVQHGRL